MVEWQVCSRFKIARVQKFLQSNANCENKTRTKSSGKGGTCMVCDVQATPIPQLQESYSIRFTLTTTL